MTTLHQVANSTSAPNKLAGVVLPDEEVAAVEKRKAEWRNTYLPLNGDEEWTFEQMVVNSVRIDRCHEQEKQLLAYEARRALLCWDKDRHFASEEIAGSLSKKPARTRRRLTRTRQGCEWLLDRWRGLAAVLHRNGEWTDAQNSLALDLAGTPIELRDDAPIEAPEELIDREVARLESLKSRALDDLDAFDREAAELGQPIQVSRPLAQLRRYEANCLRRFEAARNQLMSRRIFPSAISSDPLPPVQASEFGFIR